MNLLRSRRSRRPLFALLYFFEGAPIGFVWWALPALLTEGRSEPLAIGSLLAALVLPWSLKFLWAPLVDLLRGPRFTERGWILCSQAVMALSLAPLLWWRPGDELGWLPLLLLVHACAAATQDVAIDALVIRSTEPEERGRINGWMNAGMLIGRSVFGGWALLARGWLGDGVVVGGLIACLLAALALGFFYRPVAPPPPSRARARTFGGHLKRALRRPLTWGAFGFALLGGAAFEGVGAMISPLVFDQGGDARTVGWFFATVGVFAPLVGGLVGGRLADRRGRRAALFTISIPLSMTVFALGLAASLGQFPFAWILFLLSLVYLFLGAFTAASYAWFMDCTDPELGSTQFSAYMGATNLCEAGSALAAGSLVTQVPAPFGFLVAFGVLAWLSLIGLVWVRPLSSGSSAGDP